MELFELTIAEAHRLLKDKEISSVELTQAVLERIQALEDRVDAFITITKEEAMQRAKEADQMIEQGNCQLLTGIPLAIKDVICTRGIPTTCASAGTPRDGSTRTTGTSRPTVPSGWKRR